MNRELFSRLSPHARHLQALLALAGRGAFRHPTELVSLAGACGTSLARIPELREALRAGIGCRAFALEGNDRWRVLIEPDQCAALATMLLGVNLYLETVHKDLDEVTVVLSRPAAPSQMVEALEKSLSGTWGLSETADALRELAAATKSRLSIMSSFVDEDGANRIVELFDLTPVDARRDLVVRDVMDPALIGAWAELQRLRVNVFSFRISRSDGGGNETFHAKVLCRDGEECYVGSPNMTKWSFKYSLELGCRVRGVAAKRVEQVLDAVIAVSEQGGAW